MIDKTFSFARVYQPLGISARFKRDVEDFIVEEDISVDFSGEGEHCWLYLKKAGCNTDWVAQQLASYCGVKKNAVAYAGLKDRQAVTSQWFSVQLPGLPTPDWSAFEEKLSSPASEAASESGAVESVQVLQCFRHHKKLQRGALRANHFEITLRELSDSSDEAFDRLLQRGSVIAQRGVANYFGSQRFGHHANNLDQALKMFSQPRRRITRHKRSLYLSAARSWLFNHILSERVRRDVWDRRLPGDVFILDGRSACFSDEGAEGEVAIEQRLLAGEIHPTAVLWGDGDSMVSDEAAELEAGIIDQYPVFRDGLVAARVNAQRRACRVIPQQFYCRQQAHDLVLGFSLPAGCYATTVLAEIFSELNQTG